MRESFPLPDWLRSTQGHTQSIPECTLMLPFHESLRGGHCYRVTVFEQNARQGPRDGMRACKCCNLSKCLSVDHHGCQEARPAAPGQCASLLTVSQLVFPSPGCRCVCQIALQQDQRKPLVPACSVPATTHPPFDPLFTQTHATQSGSDTVAHVLPGTQMLRSRP